MAVGVLITMPQLEKEQYDRINQVMFGRKRFDAADAPDGLLVHSAGPTPNGWYVYDIWKSKADFERFGEEQIGPAVRKVTGRDDPQQEVQFFEIDNLVPVMLAETRLLAS